MWPMAGPNAVPSAFAEQKGTCTHAAPSSPSPTCAAAVWCHHMSAVAEAPWRRWALLGTILLGTLIGPLDSAVNIAFPDITAHFGLELKAIRWVVIAYVATYASLMLIFGRIGDLYGHDRVFIAGLIVCCAGLSWCSLARNYDELLLARMLQGLGTAMVLSCGAALVTHLFSDAARPRVLGLYAMMFGLGGALGPSVGGLLVGLWGWPAVFWSRLPLAVIALILALALRISSPLRDTGRFDLTASFLLAVASGLLLFTVSQASSAMDQPLHVLAMCAVTLAAIAAFLLHARRSMHPLLDPDAFTDPAFVWINIANIVVNVAAFSTMLFVPYFLIQVSGLPVWSGGVIMAIGPVGMMIGSQVGGWLIHYFGGRGLALAGAVGVALGLYGISFWDAGTSWSALAGGLFVSGFGLGVFQVACLDTAAARLPRSNRGVAGSLALVMRTVGVVIAASLLTLVFTEWQEIAADGAPGQDAFIFAFQSIFLAVATGLAVFIAPVALWEATHRWRRRRCEK